MRKKMFCAGLCLCLMLFSLCGCDVSSMTTLAEVSRPYTGEYSCKSLTVGGEDRLDDYDYVRLTLSRDDTFEVAYRDNKGKEGAYKGTYEMDASGESITFTVRVGFIPVHRTFPVENGSIFMDLRLRGKLLHAEFSFP